MSAALKAVSLILAVPIKDSWSPILTPATSGHQAINSRVRATLTPSAEDLLSQVKHYYI
jgi:hypothetical protein